MSLSSILIATDLSPRASLAASRASQLAAQTGARLDALHAIEETSLSLGQLWPSERDRPDYAASLERNARQRLEAQMRSADLSGGVAAGITVTTGRATESIVAHGQAIGAQLIVIGAHGKQALRDLVLGTTAENLLRYSNRPTLVVRQPTTGAYQRALIAVDFSEDARAALAFAAPLLTQAHITVLHVIDITPFDQMREVGLPEREVDRYYAQDRAAVTRCLAQFIAAAGLDPEQVTQEIATGYPATTVADVARRHQAELVVMGTRGRSRLGKLLLGTVAGRLVHEVDCDALLARSS